VTAPLPDAIAFDVFTFLGHARPAWHADAACADYDRRMWFPERGESGAEAKRICGRCNVKAECLRDAIANGEVGIWAGTTTDERARMKRAAAA
jgi:WhiB family transcriptional regulator, redox-sensing transcriptional regulator